MEYICDICSSSFTQKYNLVAHQKSAKYCIALRKSKTDIPQCEFCSKTFGSKQRLTLHQRSCVPRLQNMLKTTEEEYSAIMADKDSQIAELKSEIDSLKLEMAKMEAKYDIYEKEYHAIRDKPTTTNYNTITQNKLKLVNTSTIEPFTLDTVKKRLGECGYTYDMFLQGSLGVKKFVLGMITKDEEKSYVSTDSTRKNFHRLEMAKKWVDDKGAVFLTKVFDEMKPLALQYFGKFHEEMGNTTTYNEETDKILDTIMPVVRAVTHPEHKDRKILQEDIIRYIKPHVSI